MYAPTNCQPLRSPDWKPGLVIYCLQYLFLVASVFGEEHPLGEQHIALRFDADRSWVGLVNKFFGLGGHWVQAALVSQDPR